MDLCCSSARKTIARWQKADAMSGLIYLASPYSHHDPDVREERYLAACKATARLMEEGHVVFCPIAHSHPIEVLGMQGVQSGSFWKRQDIAILRHASELMVLCIEGWKESTGIKWEIETAGQLGIPVSYVELEVELEA